MAESIFDHLFPGNHYDELPWLAGIFSLPHLPLALAETKWIELKFKQTLAAGSLFLARTALPYHDRLQMQTTLSSVMPSRLQAHWLKVRVQPAMHPGEALGGVGTRYVDGILALTVIGVLAKGSPSGLIWLSRGDLTSQTPESKSRFLPAAKPSHS